MNRLLRLAFCFASICILFPFTVNATHLMGGNLTYEYLGLNGGGSYDYRITLTIYRLCDGGSALLPNSTQMGVYQDNPSNPSGDKSRVTFTTLNLISQQFITPPSGNDSCTFAPNVCVEEGVYQTTISLVSSINSYYLIADRCCRNNNIANLDLPGDAGQAYYALIPPTATVNSSPTFAAAPVPFICTSDTASILNQAIDADGDSLVYSFVTPYNGISTGGSPAPLPPITYPWPIQEINYNPGFSNTQPFGPGSFVSIDPTTGLASYLSPNQGFYVVAVEINEYRNGVLIGTTRRDIQLIVIACPSNPAPNLASGSTTTSYTIQEGQTLCFNVGFVDSNNDSIRTTHTGDIFNSVITNPVATFTDVNGLGSITSQFCWTTGCNQGRANPYQFSVNAIDNGCPAKTTNIVYSINVTPAQRPNQIFGPDTICLNAATGIGYSVASFTGYTYNWQVTQGSQVTGTTTNSIGVDFNGSGNAVVSVVSLNAFGCPSDTVRKNVFLKALPNAVAGSDVNFCSSGTATLGTTSTSGYTYSWSPATGLSSTTISNPTVTLTNTGTTPVSTTYILTTSFNGCDNKDTVVVTANPFPVANAGNNVSVCSGTAVPIGSLATTGYTYSWSPSTGLSNGSVANPILTLTNNGSTPDTLNYIVTVGNGFLCVDADTVQVIVRPVPTAVAGSDVTFCSDANATIGSSSTSGYTYSWAPSTGLTNATASSTGVSLSNTTTANDTVSIILTTSWFGCIDRDTVNVIVRPIPTAVAGNNLFLCSGSTGQLGTLNTTGYTYSWSPSSGLSNGGVSNPTITLTNNGSVLDTTNYIVTTTLNGCTNRDTARVIVGPVPTASAGVGGTYCSGQSLSIGDVTTVGYTYTWTPTTGLSSTTISNPISAATNTGTTPLVINYAVVANWFGCRDTDSVAVTINPLPLSVAGADQLLCSGTTINLGGTTTTGYVYNWSPSTGLSSTTTSNPTLNLTTTNPTPDTLFYTVTTTLNGCTTNDSVRIVLSPTPTAIAGGDVTFCSGQTIPIGLAPVSGYSYSWSPATGLSSSTASTPNLTLTNSTTILDTVDYVMTVNTFGCVDRDTISAFVKPLPVSEAGSNTSACSGDTLTLGTTTTSGYTYSWSPITGLSSSTISNPIVIVTNNGSSAITQIYNVTTLLNGCQTQDSIILTVNPLPSVTAASSPAAICVGSSSVLTGSGANTYNWALLSSPGTSIGIGNSLAVSPTTTTSYIVTGTSSTNCLNTDTIQVVVNPLPTVQISVPSPILCQGDTITLTGTGATNYTWSILPGGTTVGTSSTISDDPSVNTSYVLTGVDGNLCVNRDTIDIIVNPAATIDSIVGTLSVCPGVVGVQYWINNSNPASSYNWVITNGSLATGQGGDTTTIDWPGTSGQGIITVTETTDLGCQSEPVIQPVNINTILTPVAPAGSTTLCANLAQGQVYSTISTPSSTYNWFAQGGNIVSGNGGSSVTVDWTVSGPTTVALWYEESSITVDTVCFGISDTLFVTINPIPTTSAITGNSAICVSDTGAFNVTNASGSTFNWTISGGNVINGNGTNAINATWTGNTAALVTVQETNSFGCTGNPVNYNVTVNALPLANAGSNATICNGSTTNLLATGGVSYQWTPSTGLDNPSIANPIANPTSTTTYIVLVTDVNGCKNSDSVDVLVNSLPMVSAGSNTAICIGSSTTLNASGATTYVWSPATDLSSALIPNPIANPSVTTTYNVIGTDNNGCTNTSNVTVNVNSLPTAVAGSNVVICDGSSTPLNATGGLTYNWTPTSGLSNATIANPIANPTSTITYTVTVTDANGCTDDDQVEISINDQPIALFEVNNSTIDVSCAGVQIDLINNSTDALQYFWSFGDGATSSDVNPTHLYTFGGQVTIQLIAENNQCADTLKLDYVPGSLADFLNNIPNVFTPNGDNVNDCYSLGTNTNFEDCSSWRVFNRWGKLVFESNVTKKCWNGKTDNTGEDLPTGTYFYILIAGEKEYKGSLSLVR
jgi:gliding motility-associated-like protein